MKSIVVYDGTCNICAANLKWLRRLDWLHRFEAVPYQDTSLYTRYSQLTLKACEEAVHVILPNGRTEKGGDAIREVLLRLPLTAPAGVVLSIPPFRQLFRRLYPVIARNRYKLGGSCPVHPGGQP